MAHTIPTPAPPSLQFGADGQQSDEAKHVEPALLQHFPISHTLKLPAFLWQQSSAVAHDPPRSRQQILAVGSVELTPQM